MGVLQRPVCTEQCGWSPETSLELVFWAFHSRALETEPMTSSVQDAVIQQLLQSVSCLCWVLGFGDSPRREKDRALVLQDPATCCRGEHMAKIVVKIDGKWQWYTPPLQRHLAVELRDRGQQK